MKTLTTAAPPRSSACARTTWAATTSAWASSSGLQRGTLSHGASTVVFHAAQRSGVQPVVEGVHHPTCVRQSKCAISWSRPKASWGRGSAAASGQMASMSAVSARGSGA